ncbi:MAG: M23 family metallopeptidase [Bacteriovoracaceae bacterium]
MSKKTQKLAKHYKKKVEKQKLQDLFLIKGKLDQLDGKNGDVIGINYQLTKSQYKFIKKHRPNLVCGPVDKIAYNTSTSSLDFYLPIPYKFNSSKMTCYFELDENNDDKNINVFEVNVSQQDYPVRQLKVSKKHVELSQKAINRWLKEKAVQEKIYGSRTHKKHFFSPFEMPLTSKITSPYGYKRLFNNKKFSWHSGTDFRARIGTKITPSNRGVVRFAGDLYFNGKTVIIDHGMGIFTMYCHLSKLKVAEGEVVTKKTILALSGNTGRSTGPHLHWGTKVNGEWVNGPMLVEQTNQQFSRTRLPASK